MASNFKIVTHHNGSTLHIKLLGDFDGTSAFQLLDCLKKTPNTINRVIVHTNTLKTIHPFGRDVFRGRFCELNGRTIGIFFTGEKANQIAPENAMRL